MTSRKNRFTYLLPLVAMVSLVSCGTESGSPQAVETSSSPSRVEPSSDASSPKAPEVREPVDASSFGSNMCSVLTDEQKSKFEISRPASPREVNGDPSCSWSALANGDLQIGVTLNMSLRDKGGLNNLYSLEESGQWKDGYFEPVEVSGYPGAYVSIHDARERGSCSLTVATTDNLSITVDIGDTKGDKESGCKAATNVAEAAIETIKRGA